MPHLPDDHHQHDLALVAALAAGDAQGRDQTRATELVTACGECARVRDDLVGLSLQLRALPAPRRTRDFRLTADQAAALKPTGWRRLLAVFGSSGFRFATPLGTTMATLGLAGLLLAAAPTLPGQGTTGDGAQSAGDATLQLEMSAPAPAASAAAASSAPQPQGEMPSASAVPSTTTGGAAGTESSTDDYGTPSDTTAGGTGPAASAPTRNAATGSDPSKAAAPDRAIASGTEPALGDVAAGTPDPRLVLVATLLVVTGLGLVALRTVGRRLV